MRNRISRVVGILSGVSLAASASGQSFNMDMAIDARWAGPGLGTPSIHFGGAPDQAGYWNAFVTSIDGPQGVNGLDGEPLAVSVFMQGPDQIVFLDDPETEKDVEALLDDSISGYGDVVGGFNISGLTPGEYRVVVYGFAGGQPDEFTYVMVENQGGVTGGAWSGDFEEGVTHKTFGVTIDSDQMFIGIAGGVWGQSGHINGFQLTRLADCFPDINHDGFLDSGDIAEFIRLFLAGSAEADLNGDGILDSGDIQAFIRSFLAGC